MGSHGWPFASVDPFPAADVDPLYDSQHVKDLYLKAAPEYSGRLVGHAPLSSHLLTSAQFATNLSEFLKNS
jgi:glutathionyl-hydroquinone reductase